MKISEAEIERIARDALHISSGGIRKNMCDVVSNEFASLLETELNIDGIYGATYAPVKGSKHFVSLIDADKVQVGADKGYVIIDITIKQFENKLSTELPEIAILHPNDSRRDKWYDKEPTPN